MQLGISNAIRAKSTIKAWLLTLAFGSILYFIIRLISSCFDSNDINDYEFKSYISFWEPVPLLAGLLFLIILGLPLFTSAEKSYRKLSLFICWTFYLPILRGSLFPSVVGLVFEMLIPFGAGSFISILVIPFFASSTGVEDWIYYGFIEVNFAASHALIAVGLAITIVGFIQIIRAIRGKYLDTHGLYATVRHPQHFGIALWTLGIALGTARTISLIAWFTVTYFYLLLAIREERRLIEQFGEEYLSYQKTTPFIIPLLFINSGLHLPERFWKRLITLIILYIICIVILCAIISLIGVEIIHRL